ncbi:hypothetical protein LVR26_29020, partial [Pseudomonas aeruginosa]|uniref:hypothetical protein n=1 Tax=Pseudomonas aeruginosa TaxID=287 RepID=UPI002095E8F4
VSNSADPDLTALRADVLAKGGSVYMRYVSVTALSVMLPADKVMQIAERSDVQSISPNRLTTRTGISLKASAIEQAGGIADAVRKRTESNSLYYTGLDGAGVGIAVLDSAIMYKHQLFAHYQGDSRVVRGMDFQKVGD